MNHSLDSIYDGIQHVRNFLETFKNEVHQRLDKLEHNVEILAVSKLASPVEKDYGKLLRFSGEDKARDKNCNFQKNNWRYCWFVMEHVRLCIRPN